MAGKRGRPMLKWGVQSTREWGERTVSRIVSRHATRDEAEIAATEFRKDSDAKISVVNRTA